jgi:hypothetical protein
MAWLIYKGLRSIKYSYRFQKNQEVIEKIHLLQIGFSPLSSTCGFNGLRDFAIDTKEKGILIIIIFLLFFS